MYAVGSVRCLSYRGLSYATIKVHPSAVSSFHEDRETKLQLLYPVHRLACYDERIDHFRHTEQLFVCFGDDVAGKALSKKCLTSWLCDYISQAYKWVLWCFNINGLVQVGCLSWGKHPMGQHTGTMGDMHGSIVDLVHSYSSTIRPCHPAPHDEEATGASCMLVLPLIQTGQS